MKLLWQALRAVTMETLGVLLVVWLFYGVPAWSYQLLMASRSTVQSVSTRRISSGEGLPMRPAAILGGERSAGIASQRRHLPRRPVASSSNPTVRNANRLVAMERPDEHPATKAATWCVSLGTL